MSDIDRDSYWEERQEASLKSSSCRCGGDMPGRCPGPAACPMCEPEQDEEESEDANV